MLSAASRSFSAACRSSSALMILERRSPGALQLRYLQTLAEISTENASTVAFPVPIDFLTALQKRNED